MATSSPFPSPCAKVQFQSPAWKQSFICSHTISGSLEHAGPSLTSWIQTLSPPLSSSHNVHKNHAQISDFA